MNLSSGNGGSLCGSLAERYFPYPGASEPSAPIGGAVCGGLGGVVLLRKYGTGGGVGGVYSTPS